MSYALVTLFSVFTTVFLAGCSAVLWLFFRYVGQIQDRFLGRIEQKDELAREERQEQAAQYADFIEMQAQREAIIAQADKEWVEHPASSSPRDPDLDWEAE